MRRISHTRGSATEAALCTPTDWATLGARILEAARHVTQVHMDQIAQQDGWDGERNVEQLNSAEPNA